MAVTCGVLFLLLCALVLIHFRWGMAGTHSSGLGIDVSSRSSRHVIRDPASDRRTYRVDLALPILVVGRDSKGEEFDEATRTVTLSGHGASIVLNRRLDSGQEVVISRTNSREAKCRVVGLFSRQGKDLVY